MSHTALINHMGDTLVHVTAASNVPLIKAHGLMPAATLAQLAGVDPELVTLRRVRRKIAPPFGMCVLNHQKPIVQAGDSPDRVLDGYTPAQWAAQLDTRVFFTPLRHADSFKASLEKDLETAVLLIDTGALLAAFPETLDLSPINTGNFRQGGAHARRGDWIYVRAENGLAAFRDNRRKRGLVQSPDSVREVSLKGTIAPDVFAGMLKETS